MLVNILDNVMQYGMGGQKCTKMLHSSMGVVESTRAWKLTSDLEANNIKTVSQFKISYGKQRKVLIGVNRNHS